MVWLVRPGHEDRDGWRQRSSHFYRAEGPERRLRRGSIEAMGLGRPHDDRLVRVSEQRVVEPKQSPSHAPQDGADLQAERPHRHKALSRVGQSRYDLLFREGHIAARPFEQLW